MPSALRTRMFASLLLCLFAGVLADCATNPVTGKSQLSLVSEQQEIQLGQQSAQQAVQQIGLVQDSSLQVYVQRVGERLAKSSERPGLPWTFRVVDDPTPNAFALPGGFIFVTRGMMDLMNSEAELASVLGHEIGHVTARHSVTQISRTQLAQLGLGLGGVLVPEIQRFGGLAGTGLQLLFLKYGRDAERQADELGFRYALNGGYDVRQMADVFAALQRVGEREGQSPVPTWLATHPYPEERIQAVQARLAALNQPLDNATVDRAEYLRRIDGLVYGENPRNGFFRDGVFYQPDLRFRFQFPQGWKTQNLPQAVVGVSPQQDAVVQLTLAEDADPNTAARRFFAQQGVQAGQSARRQVNGLPATLVQFQAQTQQGVVQGLVAFLAYGGRVYQFVAYAPAAAARRYEPLFQQVIGSFAPVSDPQILNVRPNRVQVTRLDGRMSLAEFNRRSPSVIPLPELAIINGVQDANVAIPAGTLVKRVVAGQAP